MFGKKGEMSPMGRVASWIIILIVLVVIMFGPVSNLRAGTKDIGNKSGEFGASLKALELERLMGTDRDELTGDEKEKLAEDPNLDAKNKMNRAWKYIDERKYAAAKDLLDSARKSLDEEKDKRLLDEIDALYKKANGLGEQRVWETELEEIEKRYVLYAGSGNIEKLTEIRDDLIEFKNGKYGLAWDNAEKLLKRVKVELSSLEVNSEQDSRDILKEYADLLENELPSGKDPKTYYLDLARNFVQKLPERSREIFDLFRKSEESTSDSYSKSISIKELGDYLYSRSDLKGNAAYEYGRVVGDVELKSALNSEDLKVVLRNRGLLIDEGYMSFVKWDVDLTTSMIYDPGPISYEKSIALSFPTWFLFDKDVTRTGFNEIFLNDAQTLSKSKTGTNFNIEFWHKPSNYVQEVMKQTEGAELERFKTNDPLYVVIRFWEENGLLIGHCSNFDQKDAQKKTLFSFYMINNNKIFHNEGIYFQKCYGANGDLLENGELADLTFEGYDKLEKSERLRFGLKFNRPFKDVKEYGS
jgi:hypothetical protein